MYLELYCLPQALFIRSKQWFITIVFSLGLSPCLLAKLCHSLSLSILPLLFGLDFAGLICKCGDKAFTAQISDLSLNYNFGKPIVYIISMHWFSTSLILLCFLLSLFLSFSLPLLFFMISIFIFHSCSTSIADRLRIARQFSTSDFNCLIDVSIQNIWTAEYYDNGHCHTCHSMCETCTGPSENDCLSCASPLLRKNNKCVSSCDDGYYMEAGVCAKCLHTCTQCVSRTNCTICAKGLQLQSGECRTTCAQG